MLKELELIVGKIEECSSELDAIELKVDEKEMKRLNEIVEIAKKGLNHRSILKNTEHEKEYFKDMKGCFLLRHDDADDCEIESGKQLYLMNDGTFKIFEYNKFPYDNVFKSYLMENANIIKYFEADDIVAAIKEGLEERLEGLGNRTKTQKIRLEKLEKLEIK